MSIYIYTCTHRTHTHIFKHTYIKRTYIYLRANTKDTEAYDKIYRGDRAITGNVIQQILRGNSYVAVTGNMIEQVHRGNIRASQSQEMWYSKYTEAIYVRCTEGIYVRCCHRKCDRANTQRQYTRYTKEIPTLSHLYIFWYALSHFLCDRHMTKYTEGVEHVIAQTHRGNTYAQTRSLSLTHTHTHTTHIHTHTLHTHTHTYKHTHTHTPRKCEALSRDWLCVSLSLSLSVYLCVCVCM